MFSTSFLRHLFYGNAEQPRNQALKECHWKSKPVSYLPAAVFKEVVAVWRSAFWCKVKFTQHWEQDLGLVCLTSKSSRKESEPCVLCFRPNIWIFFLCKWCICEEEMVLSRNYRRCSNKFLSQCSKLAPFCFIVFVAVILCMFIHLDVFGFALWVYILRCHSI